jgi:hypothetical protein
MEVEENNIIKNIQEACVDIKEVAAKYKMDTFHISFKQKFDNGWGSSVSFEWGNLEYADVDEISRIKAEVVFMGVL